MKLFCLSVVVFLEPKISIYINLFVNLNIQGLVQNNGSKPCPLGFYSSGGASYCSACEPGTYTNSTGTAWSCLTCPPGSFCADPTQ